MPEPLATIGTALKSLLDWLDRRWLFGRLARYEDEYGRPKLIFVAGPVEACVRCDTALINAKVRNEGIVTLYLASRNLVYADGQPQWNEERLTTDEERTLAQFVEVHGAWCPKCRRFVLAMDPPERCPWR